jgi:hypothetical protein
MLESSTNNIMWLPWWCRNPELHLTKKNRNRIDRLLTRFIVITDFMPDAGLQAHISYIVEGKTSASLPDQSSHPPLSCSASGSYLLTIFQSTYKLCCSTLLYSSRKKSNNVRSHSLGSPHNTHAMFHELSWKSLSWRVFYASFIFCLLAQNLYVRVETLARVWHVLCLQKLVPLPDCVRCTWA